MNDKSIWSDLTGQASSLSRFRTLVTFDTNRIWAWNGDFFQEKNIQYEVPDLGFILMILLVAKLGDRLARSIGGKRTRHQVYSDQHVRRIS